MVRKPNPDVNSFIHGATSQGTDTGNPLENDDPKAARKYKSLAIPFNKYEFDRLDTAVNASGIGKNAFVRAAIEAACKKTLK
jgi:hypothetical protein